MEIKVKGIETPDGNIHMFIPPSPTETERGGIKAKAKTNETVEVVVGSDGKLYVPAYPTIDKTLASSGKAADSKVVGDKLTEVNTEITALKKSVSDGKEMLAAAITGKGVETASDDSFSTMAENVINIESGSGFDKNLRIISFYDNNVAVAQYAGLSGDHIMPPLDVNSKSYGGWEDINGEFIKFPMKINEDINLYRASKLYDLNGISLWENGWTYSSNPTRNITDEYIEFLQRYTNSSDEKNVIQTVNKYDLTNARILRFVLDVTDVVDITYTSDYPLFWLMLLPSKGTQWGLNDYSLRLVGENIVAGTYDVDLSSISGEYYIAFSCQHKNTKADIKIINIEVYE